MLKPGGRLRWMRAAQAGVGVATAIVLLSASVALAAPTAARPAGGSAPTLGLKSFTRVGAGFGEVKPRTISYGGDPTSSVGNVKWRNWGGPQAVGHGTAFWVWPGWCVACGAVELPATVVAFGRTTCQGHSAYAYVEWFFPSRGMSFNRRLAAANLCGGTSPPPPSGKFRKCGQVSLQSGGAAALAKDIETFDSPITCTTARRFVAGSGAARYLDQNARFTVHGWWCGSELSMDLGGPQRFTCTKGDFTSVTFALKPAGA